MSDAPPGPVPERRDPLPGASVPRLVVAGVASGVGKTTVTLGLARALRARGLSVSVFKCGPDYLDPIHLGLAGGRTCHNLDGWMMGREAVVSTFVEESRGSDIALIEGVMGLFDGVHPKSTEGSAAQIARWLKAPVVVVADVSGMGGTLAALVQGLAGFDPELSVAGCIANRAGSVRHLALLREALSHPPLLGGLLKRPELSLPARHLGLQPAVAGAGAEQRIDQWAEQVADSVDVDALLAVAGSVAGEPLSASAGLAADSSQAAVAQLSVPVQRRLRRCTIGVARDEAFHFYYPDNLRRLQSLGAELVFFSPLSDARPPAADALYLGGGYPELYAVQLSANRSMRCEIAERASGGTPIYAECGGLIYLSRALRTQEGTSHPMVGVIHAETAMLPRLAALGYVEVELQRECIVGAAGTRFRGHQFRYSELVAAPSSDVPARDSCAYSVSRRRGGEPFAEGYMAGNVLATYIHAHFASNPDMAEAFVRAGQTARRRTL